MPIKAIIFDLDGLLVDSEPVNFEADRELLAQFGVLYTPEIHQNILGKTILDGLLFYKERFNLPFSIDELTARRKAAQLNLLPEIKLMPDALGVVGKVKALGLKLAVATSGGHSYAEEVLQNLGIRDFFETVVTADDIKKGKPDPEIFLVAAQRLGVSPSECVVLEDALVGVEGALAAGMKAIAVPTSYAKNVKYPQEASVKSSLEEAFLLLLVWVREGK